VSEQVSEQVSEYVCNQQVSTASQAQSIFWDTPSPNPIVKIIIPRMGAVRLKKPQDLPQVARPREVGAEDRR
jgi:hypothetical protein